MARDRSAMIPNKLRLTRFDKLIARVGSRFYFVIMLLLVLFREKSVIFECLIMVMLMVSHFDVPYIIYEVAYSSELMQVLDEESANEDDYEMEEVVEGELGESSGTSSHEQITKCECVQREENIGWFVVQLGSKFYAGVAILLAAFREQPFIFNVIIGITLAMAYSEVPQFVTEIMLCEERYGLCLHPAQRKAPEGSGKLSISDDELTNGEEEWDKCAEYINQ